MTTHDLILERISLAIDTIAAVLRDNSGCTLTDAKAIAKGALLDANQAAIDMVNITGDDDA